MPTLCVKTTYDTVTITSDWSYVFTDPEIKKRLKVSPWREVLVDHNLRLSCTVEV